MSRFVASGPSYKLQPYTLASTSVNLLATMYRAGASPTANASKCALPHLLLALSLSPRSSVKGSHVPGPLIRPRDRPGDTPDPLPPLKSAKKYHIPRRAINTFPPKIFLRSLVKVNAPRVGAFTCRCVYFDKPTRKEYACLQTATAIQFSARAIKRYSAA